MVSVMLKTGRPDAFVYVGAQPALAMLARIVATLVRRPYLVRITDLAARAAVDVGIVGRRLSRALDAFEFAAYAKAAGAAVLCRSFEQALDDYGYPSDRIRVIANPIDVDRIRPIARTGRLRVQHEIPAGAFVVMHAGSMGLKQGLSTVIEAAALTRESAIHWVFIGDGEVRSQLIDATRSVGVQHKVHFLPFQPDNALSETFADADVLLVNQVRAVKDTLIPGKLLTYMAAGRPDARSSEPRESSRSTSSRCWRRSADRTGGRRRAGDGGPHALHVRTRHAGRVRGTKSDICRNEFRSAEGPCGAGTVPSAADRMTHPQVRSPATPWLVLTLIALATLAFGAVYPWAYCRSSWPRRRSA